MTTRTSHAPQEAPERLSEQADAAAARGDIAAARDLLQRLTASDPGQLEPWLKLTAMCRAAGDLPAALAAVAGALAIDPLGYLPLLLQANLLDRLGRQEEAGEVYGYALAQLPDPVPDNLRAVVEQARRRREEHVAGVRDRLADAAAAVATKLTGDEQRRLARFQTNILRTTRPYHSEPTHFHFPGLREREFHDREDFPWLGELEAATSAIVDDFHRVVKAERAELVPYVDYPDSAAMRQWKPLNRNRDWTAIHLMRTGQPVGANVSHCPATMALLERLDQPTIAGRSPNAMFSLLAPGAHIPAHNGVANTRLVCHLPLIVPPGCWFRVGAETREWEVGRAWIFDDTIEHEAMNPTSSLRVILIVDTWHPGLSPAERDAVCAVMEASAPADATEGL